jgi:hypothetical protein
MPAHFLAGCGNPLRRAAPASGHPANVVRKSSRPVSILAYFPTPLPFIPSHKFRRLGSPAGILFILGDSNIGGKSSLLAWLWLYEGRHLVGDHSPYSVTVLHPAINNLRSISTSATLLLYHTRKSVSLLPPWRSLHILDLSLFILDAPGLFGGRFALRPFMIRFDVPL